MRVEHRAQPAATFALMVAVLLAAGCDESRPGAKSVSGGAGSNSVSQAAPRAPAAAGLTAEQIAARPELVHARLRERNALYREQGRFVLEPDLGLVGEVVECPVVDLAGLRGLPFAALDLRETPLSDLGPIAGMPLKLLAIEKTRVTDLGPLKGMPLVKLYLNQTQVRDLAPLRGAPLQELMAADAKIEDLAPLQGMPLQGLWLNNTRVTRIDALSNSPLVTLTLEGTAVADLRPLAGVTTLERLHIGNTPVRDLTPLAGLKLTRLVFDPAQITNGLEVVRGMKSLRELGTTLPGVMPPDQFWQLVPSVPDGGSR